MPFDAGTVKGQIDLDAKKFIAETQKELAEKLFALHGVLDRIE